MKKIINNILHRFKEDSLAKRKELKDRKVEYKGLKDIHTCLVFWIAGEEDKGALKNLYEQMKHVEFDKLCFVKEGAEFLEADNVVTLRNEDLGFGGKIQNERLYSLLSREYDLLIDLTGTSNVMINYVLTNSQAACIAAMKKEGGTADFIVDGVAGQKEFIDRLIELLAQINKY